MKLRFVFVLIALSALLGGCATSPQPPIDLPENWGASTSGKIAVAMTPLPKADTQFPGAGCLLCLAAASVANNSLTAHAQTLSSEDLLPLKADIAKLLRARGFDVNVVEEPLDVKKLPDAASSDQNVARRNFSSLKAKYGVDKLLVIEITALGIWRNYSAYIPTSDPKAVLKGVGYIVDLGSNRLDWYDTVNIQKSAELQWDEPPRFPGLTNAYFQAIELGRQAFIRPFEQGSRQP